MRYWLGVVIAAGFGAVANAQGLMTKDLTGLGRAAAAAIGTGFEVKAEKERLTLVCGTCAGEPIIDIRIGRQTDGTEERVRSGATSMADLQRLCRVRSPSCTVSALAVEPAVGWVSGYPLGDRAGATAVIIRDGDLLTVRCLASNPAAARRTVDQLLPLVRTQIVGR
jgi:hypothetical protein